MLMKLMKRNLGAESHYINSKKFLYVILHACLLILSCSLIQPNSSIQHNPPSASTKAPASSCHSGPSFTAVTVRPELVEPIPVVNTDLGTIFAAYFKNCDLAVPWRIKHFPLVHVNPGKLTLLF